MQVLLYVQYLIKSLYRKLFTKIKNPANSENLNDVSNSSISQKKLQSTAPFTSHVLHLSIDIGVCAFDVAITFDHIRTWKTLFCKNYIIKKSKNTESNHSKITTSIYGSLEQITVLSQISDIDL